jgi:alpha-amylase
MPSLCFYFQVHQPYRLRRFSFFSRKQDAGYFDDDKNGAIMRKVANKCYLPTNKILLDLIHEFKGEFKIAFSISGVAIEQMMEYSPETLASFQELAKTGCVEFLGETFYHSLAGVYDPQEFALQVAEHTKLIQKIFGQTPRVFRNTELIYNEAIAQQVSALGFDAIIAEGCDDILEWRSPNFIYESPTANLRLLLKNYRLSDDIAFRFGNRSWASYPLTADRFANWVHAISGSGDTLNLFMDYETFGEHQWADTGIFEFLKALPRCIFQASDWGFKTPSETLLSYPVMAKLPFNRLTSWADVDRDLTAWNGNRIQQSAITQSFELGELVKYSADSNLKHIWRKLLTSDHFYYMCTKWSADGDVHAYFSPFDSPYEAFINYMNVVRHFRDLLLSSSQVTTDNEPLYG